MTILEKKLFSLNIFVYFSIAIFSYSHVDLNLTISQIPIILKFIGSMQILGYYNRPLSSLIYIILILTAFSIFIYSLYLIRKQKLSLKYVFGLSI